LVSHVVTGRSLGHFLRAPRRQAALFNYCRERLSLRRRSRLPFAFPSFRPRPTELRKTTVNCDQLPCSHPQGYLELPPYTVLISFAKTRLCRSSLYKCSHRILKPFQPLNFLWPPGEYMGLLKGFLDLVLPPPHLFFQYPRGETPICIRSIIPRNEELCRPGRKNETFHIGSLITQNEAFHRLGLTN